MKYQLGDIVTTRILFDLAEVEIIEVDQCNSKYKVKWLSGNGTFWIGESSIKELKKRLFVRKSEPLTNEMLGIHDYSKHNEWQKCPVCEGSGKLPPYLVADIIIYGKDCPTCNGHRIISRVTGKSPEK